MAHVSAAIVTLLGQLGVFEAAGKIFSPEYILPGEVADPPTDGIDAAFAEDMWRLSKTSLLLALIQRIDDLVVADSILAGRSTPEAAALWSGFDPPVVEEILSRVIQESYFKGSNGERLVVAASIADELTMIERTAEWIQSQIDDETDPST